MTTLVEGIRRADAAVDPAAVAWILRENMKEPRRRAADRLPAEPGPGIAPDTRRRHARPRVLGRSRQPRRPRL